MKLKSVNYLKIFAIGYCLSLLYACTETYQIDYEETYEDLIVVEAIITNEYKKQEIKLSNTFQINDITDHEQRYIANAEIYLTTDTGEQYNFLYDIETHSYLSEQAFQAVPETSYQLYINYNNQEYTSSIVQMAPVEEITNIKASAEAINAEDFITVRVNTTANNSNLFRYEYEETYKHIAPSWVEQILFIGYEGFPAVEVIEPRPKDFENRTCYKTDYNKNIILNNFNNTQASNTINDVLVKSISPDDYIISYRYAIKVKQYVHNLEAFSFFETLQKMVDNEDLLSPIQPGFVKGNITPINGNTKIIGIFDVATVSESERVFFNYLDYYPNAATPNYINECLPITYNLLEDGQKQSLERLLLNENFTFYEMNYPYVTIVPEICGDCRFINAVVTPPDFWIE